MELEKRREVRCEMWNVFLNLVCYQFHRVVLCQSDFSLNFTKQIQAEVLHMYL
jgi:hypothetical protein